MMSSFRFFCVAALALAMAMVPALADDATAPAATNMVSKPAPPPPAANKDPFTDPFILSIQARHQKAVDGDTKETKALTADLEKWTTEQPKNYLLLVYLGSVYTLDSRDAWPGPGKLDYLKKGGKTMDAAVAAAPDQPAVRFIRAVNYFSIPAIFGKRQTARDDFQILLRQVEGISKSPYPLNAETRQAIYYFAALSDRQLDHPDLAKVNLEKALKADPSAPLVKKIQAELDDLK